MKTLGELVRGRPVFVISPEATVLEAAQLMAEKGIGALPVIDQDRLVGIFSERDLMTRVVAKNLQPDKVKVKEVMTTQLVTAEENESYESCLMKMRQASIRHLPVISGGRFLGVISLRDLMAHDIELKDYEIQQLNHFIHYVPPEVTVE